MLDSAPDTRERILEAALREFGARGYHATSLRRIAARVALTKTAVLYHFPSKADLLAALAEPLLAQLEQAVMRASDADPDAAAWQTIEAVLDVFIQHRYLLSLNMQDLALVAAAPSFERFRAAMLRANALVAGPRPSFARRVRASQVIAVLSDPVVLFADAAEPVLRAAVLEGVRALLGDRSSTRAARPNRARGRGRPRALTPAQRERAQRLHAQGIGALAIAAELGVSRATLYRHLKPTDEF